MGRADSPFLRKPLRGGNSEPRGILQDTWIRVGQTQCQRWAFVDVTASRRHTRGLSQSIFGWHDCFVVPDKSLYRSTYSLVSPNRVEASEMTLNDMKERKWVNSVRDQFLSNTPHSSLLKHCNGDARHFGRFVYDLVDTVNGRHARTLREFQRNIC